ncbi:MAG: N-acetylmuramoyl-L-alanine amidase [Spirochaetota bacterium]|nr:N-acetylmuramoyl-L-alanine amidase [Spirochaetota bacterium]
MIINRKKYFILLFFFLFITDPLHSAIDKTIEIKSYNNKKYVSLCDFIKTFDLNNSFDIISERGKLFYKGSVVVYQVGFSLILIDGTLEKAEYNIIRIKGEIFLPLKFIKDIVCAFFPDLVIVRKGSKFIFHSKYRSPFAKYPEEKSGIERKKPIDTSRDKISFVVIDPGHGGKDPGAIGSGGKKEKWVTLKISKFLKKYLKRRLKGIMIKLSRRADVFIELEERTKIANSLLKSNENGIFVSIHANASISKKVSGFETYFLSQNPTNEDARATAALENNVVILENKMKKKKYNDVEYIEAIMITTQIQKESSILANSIQSGMDKQIWKFKSKGVKKADFFVLRGALMPSVLVEVGFITNSKEGKYLMRNGYQKKIAKGIGDGIINFIKKYNKLINNK